MWPVQEIEWCMVSRSTVRTEELLSHATCHVMKISAMKKPAEGTGDRSLQKHLGKQNSLTTASRTGALEKMT